MEMRIIGYVFLLVGILTANPHRLFEQLVNIFLQGVHLLPVYLR